MGIGGTNGSITYFPNPEGIKEVGFMPGMRAFTTDMASRYARVAASLTPLGQKGMVRRAIRVGVPGADRESVFTDVYGAWSFWHFVEFGTMNNPPWAPFRNAAEQLGFRWDDPGQNSRAH
jgi:hypothetical protein